MWGFESFEGYSAIMASLVKRTVRRLGCYFGRHHPARGANWGDIVVRSHCRYCGIAIRFEQQKVWVPEADGQPPAA